MGECGHLIMGKLGPGETLGYLEAAPETSPFPTIISLDWPQQQPGAWDREPQEGGIEDGFPHFTRRETEAQKAKSFAPGHWLGGGRLRL